MIKTTITTTTKNTLYHKHDPCGLHHVQYIKITE